MTYVKCVRTVALAASFMVGSGGVALAQPVASDTAVPVEAEDDDGDEGRWGLLGLLGLAGLLGLKRRDDTHVHTNTTGTNRH